MLVRQILSNIATTLIIITHAKPSPPFVISVTVVCYILLLSPEIGTLHETDRCVFDFKTFQTAARNFPITMAAAAAVCLMLLVFVNKDTNYVILMKTVHRFVGHDMSIL